MSAYSDSKVVDDNLGLAAAAPVSPLQTCSECEALIDITDHEPLAKINCPSCGAQLVVRGQIGPFRLDSVAGRGGMGVVYKALDTRLNRHVALKLLRKDHSGNEALIAQLATEAATTASINHPNVVKVFSTGTDRGRFYLTMELVNQGSLDDLMRLQGRVAEAQILEVAIQIAQGLRAAQQHGLIHRDVKPGNILFDDNRTAKIVDFGLAIFMEDEELARGEIWGTPYYVAPEKLDHKPEDFRSDIYSLGGSLFHALAGRPPFEAENASLVALKHLKSQPVSLQAFAPHVSGSTAYVINRTLLKDPDERYQSYDELIEHLEYAHRELTENVARPQQKRVVLESAADQKAWGWITAGMIIVILGLAIAGYFLRNPSGARQASGPTAVAQAARPTETSIFRPAREKLAEGAASEAAAEFRKLAADSSLPPVDAAWAVYQQGIAELAAGDAAAARNTFAQMKDRAAAIASEMPGLASFFGETSARLQAEGKIPAETTKNLNRDSYKAAGFLAYGLHNWRAGAIEEATTMLRQFRGSNATGSDAWITRLKPVSNPLMDELSRYLTAEIAFTSARSPERRWDAASAVREIQGTFASRATKLLEPFLAEFAETEMAIGKIPPAGPYWITNKNSGKALTVEAGSNDRGAKLIQEDYKAVAKQHWVLIRDGLAFEIVAAHSGQVIDLLDSSQDNGVKIQQWGRNGSGAQRWILRWDSRDGYKIRNAESGKVVGVGDGNKGNGASVIQWEDSGTLDQLWTMNPIKSSNLDGWNATNVGDPDSAGVAIGSESSGQFTITAAGRDIWDGDDSFYFVHRLVTGDFELVAHVGPFEKVDKWTKVGIMAREDLMRDSRHVLAGVSGEKGAFFQIRTERAIMAVGGQGTASPAPRWVRMIRKGDTWKLDESADGKTWALMENYTLKLPPSVQVGMAVTSHNVETHVMTTFKNVKLTQAGEPSAP